MGYAVFSCIGGGAAFRCGFTSTYFGHFIRFCAEYNSEPVPACIYLAAQARLETFSGMADNY
jgi:hypothetical protein